MTPALRLPGTDRPVTRRLLRVAVADDDRAAVVGDTLRRAAARHRLVVRVSRAGPDRSDLNVPPPDPAGASPADVAVGGVEAPAPLRVAVPAWSRPAGLDADPLAVRLLLLATPPAAAVDPAGLAPAGAELARWRRRVGEWARSPSGAPPAEVTGAVAAALDDGLDTPRALALLRELEVDASLAPGSRMEAFLALDRLLGLDLALGLVGR